MQLSWFGDPWVSGNKEMDNFKKIKDVTIEFGKYISLELEDEIFKLKDLKQLAFD